VLDDARVEEDGAERARGFEPPQHAVILHSAQDFDRTRGIAQQLADTFRQSRGNLIERQMTFRGIDAFFRHVDILRRRAHLTRVKRERKRDVADEPFEVRRRVDNDLIDTRLFGVDLRLSRVLFQPASVGAAAGEVDNLDFRPQRKRLRDVVAGVVQRRDVPIYLDEIGTCAA